MGNGKTKPQTSVEDNKEYSLTGGTGKTHKYKMKVWGKCSVIKVKTHGKVTIEPEKNCPFETWYEDCEELSKKMQPIVKAIAALEQLYQVYMFIFMNGRQVGLDDEKKQQWDKAVGGWGKEFDQKVKQLKTQKDNLFQQRDDLCTDFYDNKIYSLISHANDPKTPTRLDGSRRHNAQICNDALSIIPPIFFYSTKGRQFARELATILHKDTVAQHKTDDLAKFLFSNMQNASAGDLLDSTVFESTLLILDHFLPALASDPTLAHRSSLNFESRGFREFLQGKKLITATLSMRDLDKAPKIPAMTKLITWNMNEAKIELKMVERANELKCIALNNVLNTISFFSAMDDLGKNKSFYAKMKGIKTTADLISSLSKFSELRHIQAVSKASGVVGLALDGGLSAWDASKQLNLSNDRDDRTLLASAHLLKAVGAGIMLCSLPIGAAIYLLGTLGVIELDHDPYIEWAKYTWFGANQFRDKKYSSSNFALLRLEKIMQS